MSVTTICKREKQLQKEGNLHKHPIIRPFRKIDPEKLKEYIKTNSDAYLHEIAVVFDCSSTAIRKALKKFKITRKKKDHMLHEQKPEKVKEYLENIRNIPQDKIVYVDETGIGKCLSRKYGHSPIETKIYGKVYGHKFDRINIVAAQQKKSNNGSATV